MLTAVLLLYHVSMHPVTPTTPNQQMMMMLSQQVMMQQTADEEKTRTDGDSGIKQIRSGQSGTKSYYSPTHVSGGIASIHNHGNNIRTVGLGEFTAVMNGVEFRTRHNDYRLVMPHRTSTDYHAVEDIPFPEIPPEVTNKLTPEDEIKEMREWFKAWKDQNTTHRNYPEYFKPILCYLEGAWTRSQAQVEEPFFSDRHFIDAETWHELLEKVRFTTYTGKKSTLENYSFLPTKLMGLINGSIPNIAQWNYRILCQPLSHDLPLNRLRLVEDLKTRLSTGTSFEKLTDKRQARFSLNPWDSDKTKDKDGSARYGLLDELMHMVPGKDNLQGNITDDAFDVVAHDIAPAANSAPLNAAFYTRYSMSMDRDAMGQNRRKAGFSDDNLFVALTTQERVVGRTASKCEKVGKDKVCEEWKEWTQRASYALPLEIVYLTPLCAWNPYKIVNHNSKSTVVANGRNGKETLENAYNGTYNRLYFRTPNEFYTGLEVDTDAADTSGGSYGVLDKDGTLRSVRASGIRVHLPNIEGVGILRQRYPIMSVYAEGSTIWKELEALREIVLKPILNARYLYEEAPNYAINETDGEVVLTLITGMSKQKKIVSHHQHKLGLTAGQVAKLKNGETVKVLSSEDGEPPHRHTIVILYSATKDRYSVSSCDEKQKCWGRHQALLYIDKSS